MPQILTIILVLAGVMAVFAVVFWFLIKKALAPKDYNKNGDRAALMMQEQLKDIKEALHKTNLDIRNTLDNRIGESTKAMQSQIGHSAKIISEVTDKLTKLDETNKQVIGFARQLEKLEKLFKQDLKNRIDETSKYIRPNEDTTDFAFMFIPSEGIFYDLLINQVGAVKTSTVDLIEYAFRLKKVIIVSPTTFMAYLQTVLQGLRALQIEESAKEIRKRVEDL